MDGYVVARAQDIAEGERIIVEVEGRSVGVFNVEGRFHAVLNRCPHKGGQLCKGDIIDEVQSDGPGDWRLDASRKLIVCPWHGWEYDLDTGQSWYTPYPQRARPLPVEVRSGAQVADAVASGASELVTTGAQRVDAAAHRVKGPYVAELLPVAVEDAYVVVRLRPAGPPREE